MTIEVENKQCRQCGFPRAEYELDCFTNVERFNCRMCGHGEVVERTQDGDGKVTSNLAIYEGSGVLYYPSAVHYLSSQEEVLEAEDWLRRKLASGRIYTDSAYLTRWNGEKKAVEFVIGVFREFQGDNSGFPEEL